VIELRIDAQSAAGAVARDGASGGDEDAAMRVHLWKQAAKAGADSWGLGLGPGPHLEIPQSILAGRRGGNRPINLHHPKPGIAANFEAHNAVLELFVQGGLLAVLAFGLIVIVGLYRSWEAERDGVFALLFAVAAFGVFHVHFRHPLVWFAICLALTQHPRALKCGSAKPQAWPNGAPLRRIVLAPATRGPVRIATNASRGFW
jgi:O-antigen ligase